MKSILMLLTSLSLMGAVQATPLPETTPQRNRLLIERSTHVGFAPPEHVGLYKFQILTSGIVQKINNKNKIEKLAKLSGPAMKQLLAAVNAIDANSTLETDESRPRCADAPSHITSIYQQASTALIIQKEVDCVVSTSTSSVANRLAERIKQLEAALTNLDSLTSTYYSPSPLFFDPTAPLDETSHRVIECTEEPPIADDGFSLYLTATDFDENTYSLTIERSLLIGPRAEKYFVMRKSPAHPASAPILYEGSTIKLTIEEPTPARPDGKSVGRFTRNFGSHRVESRNLLCSHNH